MVKKLLKYEYKYYIRILFPVWLALIGVAGICRVIQFFESDSVVYTLLLGSSVLAIYLVALGAGIATTIISVLRFYKNFFSKEGYLTLTLPVTPEQHIFAKLIAGITAFFGWALALVVSLCIALAGEVFVEVIKAGRYLFKLVFQEIGFQIIPLIIGLLLVMPISYIFSLLVYYSCISIGQTFKKAKIIGAVGIYFGYYMVNQAISTIFVIVFAILEGAGALNWFDTFVNNQPFTFFNIVLALIIITDLGLASLLFILNKQIIHKKLNLE